MNRPNRPPRRLCLLLALLLGILPGCGRSAAPSRSADGIRVGVGPLPAERYLYCNHCVEP